MKELLIFPISRLTRSDKLRYNYVLSEFSTDEFRIRKSWLNIVISRWCKTRKCPSLAVIVLFSLEISRKNGQLRNSGAIFMAV